MPSFLSPVFGAGAQLFDNQGRVLAGGKIYTYIGGTTTPLATFVDNTDLVTNPNPIILDSAGRPPNEIWLEEGTATKFVLTDSLANVLGTWDNVAGVNDITTFSTTTEWANTNLTPSYISGTSFSVAGNNTSVFPINRRVQIAETAGTIYGYVTASSFGGGITTVTVKPDSTVIDSGISAVMVGLLQSDVSKISVPQQYLAFNAAVSVASAATTPIGAALSANVTITGVVTITAFDTVIAGIVRFVKFAGVLTLTHNGTSLILPGAANITTSAGDQAIFRSLGSGNWECLSYEFVSASGDSRYALKAGSAAQTFDVANAAAATNAVALQQFTSGQTLAATGAQPLPGGLLFKWGINTTGVGSAVTVTFATAFPGGIFGVFCQSVATGHYNAFLAVTSSSQTQFTVESTNNLGGGGDVPFFWFAIGV